MIAMNVGNLIAMIQRWEPKTNLDITCRGNTEKKPQLIKVRQRRRIGTHEKSTV